MILTIKKMRQIIINMFLIFGLFLHIKAQKIPKEVTDVVENFLLSDTTHTSYQELIKKKSYFLLKLESVLYKYEPTSIYVFGNGDPELQWSFLLFISERNGKNYTILGTEDNLLTSMKILRSTFFEASKVSGETVNSCYGYLMQNWIQKGMINTYPR